jgi:3-methylcrotonyl-CoA carboxylase alpha subunit
MSGFLILNEAAYPIALIPQGSGYALANDDGEVGDPAAVVARTGDRVWVHLAGRNWELTWQDAVSHFAEEAVDGGTDSARAPMPGAVVSVAVEAGAQVAAGDALMVIESMKLETTIRAPRDGSVETVHFGVGQTFDRDALLVTLTEVSA